MFTVHVVYQLMMKKEEEGRRAERFCRRSEWGGAGAMTLVSQPTDGRWEWVDRFRSF